MVLRPRRLTGPHIAKAMRRSFADLGPTFIRFGQLMSSGPGLFPETLANECRLLLDRVPAERFGREKEVIETDLGGKLEELFSSFEETS